MRYADPEVGVRVIKDFSTAYHHVNGGGDRVHTDGDLPVVDVRGAADRSDEEVVVAAATRRLPHEQRLAPLSLWTALVLGCLQALNVALMWFLNTVEGSFIQDELGISTAALWTYTAFAVADLVFAIAAIKRRAWGLTGLRLTHIFTAASTLWMATTQGQINPSMMLTIGLAVLVLWAVSGQRAQIWASGVGTKDPVD